LEDIREESRADGAGELGPNDPEIPNNEENKNEENGIQEITAQDQAAAQQRAATQPPKKKQGSADQGYPSLEGDLPCLPFSQLRESSICPQ